MKTVYLKIAVLIIFLAIMVPVGKISAPNGGILLVMIVQIFEYFPKDGLKLNIDYNAIIAVFVIVSFVFVFIEKKMQILICIIIQYLYLLYIFKHNFLSYWYFTIPTSIYLILSLVLIYCLFFKNQFKDKIID
jgi:hypothetical protein